jgi:hypothetical protein
MPGAPDLDGFEHWRQCAEDARALAERMGDGANKAMMPRIAADYDKLALTAAIHTALAAGIRIKDAKVA